MIREVHRGIRAQRVRDGDRDEKLTPRDLFTGAADEGRLGSIIVEGQRDLRRTGAIGTTARNEGSIALETLRDMQARFTRRDTGIGEEVAVDEAGVAGVSVVGVAISVWRISLNGGLIGLSDIASLIGEGEGKFRRLQ